MLRILTVAIFFVTLCMAGVLYKIKYDSRSLQLEAVQLRQKIALERQRLAVLKAEWSILTQPKRIEQLANSIGLQPLSPKQIISYRDLNNLPENQHVPFAALKTRASANLNVKLSKDGLGNDEPGLVDEEEFSQIDRLIGSVVAEGKGEVSDAR